MGTAHGGAAGEGRESDESVTGDSRGFQNKMCLRS
jgi:hypothetical protein